MSVLETPRILFSGQIAWDPIVTNNRANFYDEDSAETVLTPNETAEAFRQSAIAAVQGGIWNPQGTHRSVYYDSAVSGVDLGAGSEQGDPFVGAPANFAGMLVDAEPYGAYTSQLFFDSICFGVDGGYRILAPRSARFTARQINFGRNINYQVIAGLASVVWQSSFLKSDGLRIDPFDSPALQQLCQCLDDDGVLGLTIRWNAYRTLYYNTMVPGAIPLLAHQLTQKLEAGGFQPNPARSEIVGVIGLWREGEPPHEPGDRALVNTEPQTGPSIATASARLTDTTLTLDLANSISEEDITLVKQDLGPLTAVAVGADGQTVVATLGTFGYDRYDRAAYLATSGIVTLAIGAEAAQAAKGYDLQLRGADGTIYLAEQPLRALPLDPNLYVDEGEQTATSVQVLDRGAPAASGLNVTLAMTKAAGGPVIGTSNVTTGPGGIAPVPVSGAAGDVAGYILLPGPNPVVPTALDTQVNTYMYIRTLPAGADIAALPPTWNNVYARVLLNWHAMAPCMDNWLDLGSEAQVRAYAPVLKKLTDPARFEAFRFMPVTRDMTAGERTLLYNFLDAPPAALESVAAEEPAARPRSQAQLSRAMRGN